MNRESVLITGAGRGLGKELALVFAEKGYDLILNGRDIEKLADVVSEASRLGAHAYHVCGDIKEDKTINELEKIASVVGVSVLINNAGAPAESVPFEKMSDAEIEELVRTNLVSPMKLARRIYSMLAKKGYGTVINLNSLIGLECKDLKAVGCAARWGLRGFTGSLRMEAEKNGIHVIGVYPTRIKTKPEYSYGFEPREVAMEIYSAHERGFSGMLVLDGRPEEFKPNKNTEYG